MGKAVISNNIRRLRFFANEMTQQELADKTGVSRQTIVAIENGKYFPTLELAFRIAHAFQVPEGRGPAAGCEEAARHHHRGGTGGAR